MNIDNVIWFTRHKEIRRSAETVLRIVKGREPQAGDALMLYHTGQGSSLANVFDGEEWRNCDTMDETIRAS